MAKSSAGRKWLAGHALHTPALDRTGKEIYQTNVFL
jgi:hypothetical protein